MKIGKMRGQAATESPAATARHLHGQAAMEYLMTYGWALLVIVAVIAVLLIINPFAAPAGCRFDQVGFQCANPLVKPDGVGSKLYVQITNANNNAIVLHNATCTTDKSSTVPGSVVALTGVTQTLAKQASTTLELKCFKPNGDLASVTSGNDFSGKIWIFYNNEEDPTTGTSAYPARTVSATVTTKVTQ